MPRDANGNTSPIPGSIVATGDTVLPSQHNPPLVDLYAMMTQSLSRDGQGGMRSNLAMNGFRVTGAGPAVDANDLVTLGTVRDAMPIGVVVDFCGSTAPSGWMLCYGQAISRASYPSCFSTIGTTFGSGDGSTTFNLPDLRGRILAGKDNMGGALANRLGTFSGFPVGAAIGYSGGNEVHVLTEAQIPSHRHSGATTQDGEHIHANFYTRGNTQGAGNYLAPSNGSGGDVTLLGNSGSAGTHNHTFDTSFTGGSGRHNNVQPTMIINKIIKVSY